MYLGTCLGVKMSSIDSKDAIGSLNGLPSKAQRELNGEMLIETAIENLRNTTQEKHEFIRHAQLDLCDFYAGIKHHFVQFI